MIGRNLNGQESESWKRAKVDLKPTFLGSSGGQGAHREVESEGH